MRRGGAHRIARHISPFRGRRGGFSLVEVLAALSIGLLALVLASDGLRLGTRVWEAQSGRAHERIAEADLGRLFSSTMADARAWPLSAADEGGAAADSGTPLLGFFGGNRDLAVVAAIAPTTETPHLALVRIALRTATSSDGAAKTTVWLDRRVIPSGLLLDAAAFRTLSARSLDGAPTATLRGAWSLRYVASEPGARWTLEWRDGFRSPALIALGQEQLDTPNGWTPRWVVPGPSGPATLCRDAPDAEPCGRGGS